MPAKKGETETKPPVAMNNGLGSFGTFTSPVYITIDDPYGKKPDEGTRHKGKQLQTNPPRRGKVGRGVTFDEFKPLFEKESYTDPGTFEKEHVKTEKKKIISEKPFKPSSPPKKATGLGTYFGTIGKQFEHLTEYEVMAKSDKPPEIKHQKPNILTSPPKKGTYGFPKLTIGAESDYKTDPYDAQRQKEIEEKKKNVQKRISTAPFKAMTKTLDYFDTYPNVAASKVYTLDKPIPEAKSPPKEQTKTVSEKPFKPSSPPKAGYNGTFKPFPEYMSDPYDKNALTAEQLKEKRAQPKEQKPVWKTVSCPKSSPTKSVIFASRSLNSTL